MTPTELETLLKKHGSNALENVSVSKETMLNLSFEQGDSIIGIRKNLPVVERLNLSATHPRLAELINESTEQSANNGNLSAQKILKV